MTRINIRVLESKARMQKKSVGALVRDTIEKAVILDERDSKRQRLEAARRIVSSEEEVTDWKEIERSIAEKHIR